MQQVKHSSIHVCSSLATIVTKYKWVNYSNFMSYSNICSFF